MAIARADRGGARRRRVAAARGGRWPRPPRPTSPPRSRSRDGYKVFLVGHAIGVQIYSCSHGTGFAWGSVAPRANLYDDNGKLIGTHFGGPTWQAQGRQQGRRASVDARVTVDPDRDPVAAARRDVGVGRRGRRTGSRARSSSSGSRRPAGSRPRPPTAPRRRPERSSEVPLHRRLPLLEGDGRLTRRPRHRRLSRISAGGPVSGRGAAACAHRAPAMRVAGSPRARGVDGAASDRKSRSGAAVTQNGQCRPIRRRHGRPPSATGASHSGHASVPPPRRQEPRRDGSRAGPAHRPWAVQRAGSEPSMPRWNVTPEL